MSTTNLGVFLLDAKLVQRILQVFDEIMLSK